VGYKAVFSSLFFLCFVFSPSVGVSEGMSREQGDIILEELRQIRTLLERMPRRPGPMPQTTGPQAISPQDPAPKKTLILKVGEDSSLGRSDAPVIIVEFTDFQCPFCSRFQANTFPEIRRNFIDTGKVRFIKRDLPLAAHPDALKAAQAGRCAGDQGKFWEMYDLLSANFSLLGPEAYAMHAKKLSLDPEAFKACVDSDRHLADIRTSVQEAAAAGIRSTPSFLIGTVKGDTLEGTWIKGAQPYAVFEKTIMEILKGRAG
jgi:protein-disulfide isomerase